MTHTGPWPPATLDHALQLLAYGYNNREIGERLIPPRSKNSVVGKLWRSAETKLKREERLKARREKEAHQTLDRKIAAKHDAARLVRFYSQQMSSRCYTADCHNTKQPGDRHGLCASCRRDRIPDRTSADMADDTGPVGW